MGTGPIPWKDIVFYARFWGIEDDLLAEFITVIKTMDSVYLKWVDAQKPKQDG